MGDNRCFEDKSDCFALGGGRCRILNDTDFGDRACPFYKPAAKDAEPDSVETAVEIPGAKYSSIEIRSGLGILSRAKKRP